MKKIVILICIIISLTSCSPNIYKIDSKGFMSMYLRHFAQNYYEQPSSIDFLIKAFDEEESAENNHEIYSVQYKLMNKYRKKLLLHNTDSTTELYYKKINESHLIAFTDYITAEYNCYDKYRFMYSYYNKEGFLSTWEAKTIELKKEVANINKKYEPFQLSDSCSELKFRYIILQYTDNNRLINFDTKTSIDYNHSDYYGEILDFLKMFSQKYYLSKIIMPCLIPINEMVNK